MPSLAVLPSLKSAQIVRAEVSATHSQKDSGSVETDCHARSLFSTALQFGIHTIRQRHIMAWHDSNYITFNEASTIKLMVLTEQACLSCAVIWRLPAGSLAW